MNKDKETSKKRRKSRKYYWKYTKYQPYICLHSFTSLESSSLLLHEGVRDGLHAVHRADQHDGGTAADDQPEVSRVLGKFVRVIGVSKT